MSRKIKTDIVLEVHGVRHHLVKESIVSCRDCSLDEICNEMLLGNPCELLANGAKAHFEKWATRLKKGGEYEQKDKD